MDHAIADFAHARQWMVDGQVRPNKVQDGRVIEAMRHLPREDFVPPAQAALAYAAVHRPDLLDKVLQGLWAPQGQRWLRRQQVLRALPALRGNS